MLTGIFVCALQFHRSSILHKQFDSVIPGPLTIASNEAWILFASMPDLLEEEPTESYFTIETHTVKTHTQLGMSFSLSFQDCHCVLGLV